MKDKYWALILIVVILLAGLSAFLVFENVRERYYEIGYDEGYKVGYDKKICACITIDNYNGGYKDCEKKYKERIDYCFWKCSLYHTLLVDDQISKTCMWRCLHPNYGIAKIN